MSASVAHALKGNFLLLKPRQCLPPDVMVDETGLEVTDELVCTSILANNSHSDGYDTAPSECDDSNSPAQTKYSSLRVLKREKSCNSSQRNCIEKDATGKYISLNKLEQANWNNIPVPERTATDQFIFRNQFGKLKRFYSTLHWIQAEAESNKRTCLDCAAQISTRDLTITEEDSPETSVANSLEVPDFFKDSKHLKASEKSVGFVSNNCKSCFSTNYATTINECLHSDSIFEEVSTSRCAFNVLLL